MRLSLRRRKKLFPFGLGPFEKIPIETGMGKKRRCVGNYKGLVRFIESHDAAPFIDPTELNPPKNLYIRLYVIRGIGLANKDSNGKSDPYLIVSLGDEKQSRRHNHLNNTLDPGFFESFEFSSAIPGPSNLIIKVFDWDGIFDDIIGQTTIDIEDRWLTPSWREMKLKPIERRTLLKTASNASQGTLELWLEILKPAVATKNPIWDIHPPPPIPYELRVIIWGVRDCAIKDSSGMDDLYVSCHCSYPGLKKQKNRYAF